MAKILVVDDEFGIGELLRELLSDEDHDVTLAINGRQGLEQITKEPPDLVFVDFMMPVLNGAGMLKAMAADPAMAQIPVIIMSSLPEATVSERAEGHVAFVRKPFQVETILEVTATALAGRGKMPVSSARP
jgi:CheY-like chemotaxis protein